jgi:hypothetical protein
MVVSLFAELQPTNLASAAVLRDTVFGEVDR